MAAVIEAPSWDMSVVWPSLASPEFEAAYAAVVRETAELEALFDRLGIRAGAPSASDDTDRLTQVVEAWNGATERTRTLRAYINGFLSVDTKDELAQAKDSGLDSVYATRAKLRRRLEAWAGTRLVDKTSSVASDNAYWLAKAAESARHQMSEAEEALAADLAATGTNAWDKLHNDVTSQLKVPYRGGEITMNEARNLAYDPDRTVRQDAYEAELAAWPKAEVACAAAVNGIKGATGLLEKRRGWTPLDVAVFHANIDRDTLEAMLAAARDAFPVLRRYLRAKAKLVAGSDRLDWCDLFAPVGKETRRWEFGDAAEFVAAQFHTFSPRMGDLAERAVREKWIDAAPKPNKVGGAFCMGLRGGESRLLQTWKPSFGALSTLAHELGHAYHNLCLEGRTPLQRETPMTLAETASIFCETIVSHAAAARATGDEKLVILEQSLQRSTQVVVDITSRYLFESSVYAKRPEQALSPGDLCRAMLDAQESAYGDGLSEARHPYMWAAKPHYYSERAFYNFPYMFGNLFSLGLYAVYEKDKAGFVRMYDELLSSTGLYPAKDLAARFGIDITDKAFWAGSLATVATEVEAFEKAAES